MTLIAPSLGADGFVREPVAGFATGDQWLRLGASDAVPPGSAFETVAADLFAQTDPFLVNTITSGTGLSASDFLVI